MYGVEKLIIYLQYVFLVLVLLLTASIILKNSKCKAYSVRRFKFLYSQQWTPNSHVFPKTEKSY